MSCTAADDSRPRRVQECEPIERALGTHLLNDADQRVRDQHDPEQGVLRLADDEDHGEQGCRG